MRGAPAHFEGRIVSGIDWLGIFLETFASISERQEDGTYSVRAHPGALCG